MKLWEHQIQAVNFVNDGISKALKRKEAEEKARVEAETREEAEECVQREFCPGCKGYGFEGEGCIIEDCEIFQEEVEQTLKDWATVPD